MSFLIYVRDSPYGMPLVQSVHLVGLTLLLATVVVLNLRLAGVALKDSSAGWLTGELRPWLLTGLAIVVLSGVFIFICSPAKYLVSNPFRVKMAVLLMAIGSFVPGSVIEALSSFLELHADRVPAEIRASEAMVTTETDN